MAYETTAEHASRCTHKVNHRPEDCPSLPQEPTTAQTLGAYRRELESEGITFDTIDTLVVEAARTLLRNDPLVVGGDLPQGMTMLTVSIPLDSSLVTDRQAVERAASEGALQAIMAVIK